MHDHDTPTRIDLAGRLDAALDAPDSDDDLAAVVLPLADADAVARFVTLAAEIREVLHRPVLSAGDRARIHGRVLDLAGPSRRRSGLRRAWPQLVHRGAGVHPAVLGGAAAAVLAVVGVAALQRRGHAGQSVLQAA